MKIKKTLKNSTDVINVEMKIKKTLKRKKRGEN